MANEQLCKPSCSRKRKQPDCDENEFLSKQARRHLKQSFENDYEYEHLEEDYDDLDDDDDDEIDNDNNVAKSEDLLHKAFVAQEKSTIKEYDGIKITPFNLDEECKEGEFDKTGNFIFKSEKKNIGNEESNSTDEEEDDVEDERDTWADSIDWLAVEREEKEKKERELLQEKVIPKDDLKRSETIQKQPLKRTKLDCYKQMLRLIRPEETVQKGLRRLGNNIPKRRPNQYAKRKLNQDTSMDISGSSDEIAEHKRKLNLLIELAHQLLEEGDTDIYQKTYEQLEDAIN